METCIYCRKECKNKNSQVNHQRFCHDNPNRVLSPFELRKRPKGTIPWNKGLTKDDAPQLTRTDAMKKHLSLTVKGIASTPEKETARREKIRNKINERYSAGWESTAGRCLKYDYNSPIAGKIKIDGTWELSVAKYFDKLGLTWYRNKKRFPYVKPGGKKATYQPDFFIADWDTFLEVKGYETDLDRCKWSQFKEPLLIWKKAEITKIILESKSGSA